MSYKGKRFIYVDGKMIPKEDYIAPVKGYIIRDEMPDTFHPCDGNHYNSKSTFRKVTQAHGGIEVGNEKLEDRPKIDSAHERREVRQYLREALEKLNSGR